MQVPLYWLKASSTPPWWELLRRIPRNVGGSSSTAAAATETMNSESSVGDSGSSCRRDSNDAVKAFSLEEASNRSVSCLAGHRTKLQVGLVSGQRAAGAIQT